MNIAKLMKIIEKDVQELGELLDDFSGVKVTVEEKKKDIDCNEVIEHLENCEDCQGIVENSMRIDWDS